MEYDDVDLEFTPEALEAIAGRAVERGIGARGLRAILEEVMTRIMYDVPSDPEVVKVTITAACIRGEAAPEISRATSKWISTLGNTVSPRSAITGITEALSIVHSFFMVLTSSQGISYRLLLPRRAWEGRNTDKTTAPGPPLGGPRGWIEAQ